MAEDKYLNQEGVERLWSRIKSWLSSNYALRGHNHTYSQIINLNTWKKDNFGNASYEVDGGSLRIYGHIDLYRPNMLNIKFMDDDIDLGNISRIFTLIIYEDSTVGTTAAKEITYILNNQIKVNIWQMEFRSGSSASWQWKQAVQGQGEHTYALPRRKDGNIVLALFLSTWSG